MAHLKVDFGEVSCFKQVYFTQENMPRRLSLCPEPFTQCPLAGFLLPSAVIWVFLQDLDTVGYLACLEQGWSRFVARGFWAYLE